MSPEHTSDRPNEILVEAEQQGRLDKFHPEELEGVTRLANAFGAVTMAILDDYELTMAAIAAEPLLLLASQHQELTEDMFLILVDLAPEQVMSQDQLATIERQTIPEAIGAVEGLRLSKKRQDPRVEPALSHLRDEIAIYEPQFENRAILCLLHGSFYFGDPSESPDLDIEFAIAAEGDAHKDLEKAGFELTSSVMEHIDSARASQYTPIINLAKTMERIRAVDQGNFSRLYNMFSGTDAVNDLTVLLNAEVIHLPGAKKGEIDQALEEVRRALLSTAEQNAVFRLMLALQYHSIMCDRTNRYRPARAARASDDA